MCGYLIGQTWCDLPWWAWPLILAAGVIVAALIVGLFGSWALSGMWRR